MDADSGAPRTLVTKAEFARRVKRSPGRVTQWITEGKIGGAALAIEMGRELIVLETALAQLGLSLDVGQQLGQDVPILPVRAAAAAKPVGDDVTADAERRSPDHGDELQARLAAARVTSAEIKAEEDRRRALEANGTWVRADAVAATWARGLGELIARLESEFPGMADRLALEFKVDARALAIALRREFHGVRGKIASEAATRRDAEPPAAADADEKAAA